MLLFVIFGAIAIAAGLGVILSRKPVYSALFLLLNFGSLAALYIMLQAQFLAAVQVIVYAGAIVVLFLFVMMLVGGGEIRDASSAATTGKREPSWTRIAALVLAGVLVAGLGYGIVTGTLNGAHGSVEAFGQGSVQAIGQALYTTYLFPFELTSVLLLVGIIGAVVLARKEQ